MKEAFEHSFSINVATAVGVEKSIILREIRKMGFQNSTSGKDCQYGKRWVKCPSLLLHSKFKYLNQKSISRWLSEMKQGEKQRRVDQSKQEAENELKAQNEDNRRSGRIGEVLQGAQFTNSIEARARVIQRKRAVWDKLVNKPTPG